MPNGFRLTTTLPAEPRAVYKAWLSGREHTAMTGGKATAGSKRGDRFTAWDGYISGRNLILKPHWCIVQFWRTRQFTERDPDSRLELCIHPKGKGSSELLLIHSGLPADQVEYYRQGWPEYYFRPMQQYFSARTGGKSATARKNKKKRSKQKKAKRAAANPVKRKPAARKSNAKKSVARKTAKRRARR